MDPTPQAFLMMTVLGGQGWSFIYDQHGWTARGPDYPEVGEYGPFETASEMIETVYGN